MRMSLEDIFLSLTTEEAAPASAGRRRRPCNDVTSSRSRRRSCKSYFASPIAYIVIGFFALLYGYFYVSDARSTSSAQSMQMSQMGGGPQPVNINEMMIRPLLQNVTILMLFVLPMITMRTYSEEKRSGTIELLLTSPLTDFQIILGKFLGALALYAVDAGGHADPHRACCSSTATRSGSRSRPPTSACCCSAAASSRSACSSRA